MEQFYAISGERQLRNPSVLAVTSTARATSSSPRRR
jgi:hypothetical protein